MVIVLTTKRFSYFIISSRETYDEVGFAKYHHAQLRTKLREAHEACCLTDIVNIYYDATRFVDCIFANQYPKNHNQLLQISNNITLA